MKVPVYEPDARSLWADVPVEFDGDEAWITADDIRMLEREYLAASAEQPRTNLVASPQIDVPPALRSDS